MIEKYEFINSNWPLSHNDMWIMIFPITKYDTTILHSILQSTATIFGVVIGLSIISIEHAAGNYTPKIIKIFKEDEFVIFPLIIIDVNIINRILLITVNITNSSSLNIFMILGV